MTNLRAEVKYFSRFEGDSSFKFVSTEFDEKLNNLSESESGLNDEEIETLLKVVTKAKLSAKHFRQLLHCILPEDSVKNQHTRIIVMWLLMNHRIAPVTKVTAVLQWLNVLLETQLIEKSMVDSFYHQFFYLAIFENLARNVCKLLYLLTTPNDITRERVERLLLFHRKTGRGRHFVALLGLFKSIRPELVPERIQTVNPNTAFGKIPSKLLAGINKALSKHNRNYMEASKLAINVAAEEFLKDDDSCESDCSYTEPKIKRKRKRDHLISEPSYITFGSKAYSETGELKMHHFKTLESLAALQVLMEVPNSSLSLLQNSFGRHILTFDHSQLQIRFSYQLHHLLDEVFLKCQRVSQPEEKKQLLKWVASLQNYAHQALPVVSLFVKNYLFLWQDGPYIHYILKLMHWLHFTSHTDLIKGYLSPLYTLFISSGIKTKCSTVRALGQLFSNLVMTHKYQEQEGLFMRIRAEWDGGDTLTEILKFASYMFSQGLSQAGSTILLLNAIVRFYETVLTAIEEAGIHFPVLLPPGLISAAIVSYDISILSRVCELLTRCSVAVKGGNSLEIQEYHEEVFKTLNQYNVELWSTLRGQAFPAPDGIFYQWMTKIENKNFCNIPIVDFSDHPAVTCAVWSLHQQNDGTYSNVVVDMLSTFQKHLPHIYKYLVRQH